MMICASTKSANTLFKLKSTIMSSYLKFHLINPHTITFGGCATLRENIISFMFSLSTHTHRLFLLRRNQDSSENYTLWKCDWWSGWNWIHAFLFKIALYDRSTDRTGPYIAVLNHFYNGWLFFHWLLTLKILWFSFNLWSYILCLNIAEQ